MAKEVQTTKVPTLADYMVKLEYTARSCFADAKALYEETLMLQTVKLSETNEDADEVATLAAAEAQKVASAHVLQVRNLITKLSETLNSIRQTWDNQHDMKAMYGADMFSAKVVRIRKATERTEKAEEVNPLDAFTL